MDQIEFARIIKGQDELISAMGVDVWVGMEPTFTRRLVETPEWLSEALGPEKLQYAYTLLEEIYHRQPGGIVLHTLGRQYGGEELPRWSIGYYQARNNKPLWNEPRDPCLATVPGNTLPAKPADIAAFWQTLNDKLAPPLWNSKAFTVDKGLRYRLLFRRDGTEPEVDFHNKPLLSRSSIHESRTPLNGLTDELAAHGDLLLCLDSGTADETCHTNASVVIELPEVPDVTTFMQLLQCIAQAAKQTGIETLALQGFPPPVDTSVAWTTITPDPAVIEINQAPAYNATNFLAQCELYYGAAQAAGLHPCRLHYNGEVSDSGGGGQFTLGGPEPLQSPFFRFPHLLPRVVRYFNAHPALSYWFAFASIGSSSQSPRADENVQDSFRELSVALEKLESIEQPEPEFIWRSLSPFLVDLSGNPHRSELNIEKLWNPFLPVRGCLGLVEFRSFRMARSPQSATAIAVLLRSIVAMLCHEDKSPQLIDHGTRLHDKYALPFYLHKDLENVLQDLHDAGLPVHEYLKTILFHEPIRFIGRTEFHGCTIELNHALEFWPLIGDATSQRRGGSRLVDASTKRLQVTISMKNRHASQPGADTDDWELWLDGYRVPLHQTRDRNGAVLITGLRYRNFMPNIGLHPGIESRDSITLILANRDLHEALQITYYEWHPQNLPYPGLPEDTDDAARRRHQRFTTSIIPFQAIDQPKYPPDSAITDYCLDLRRLP
jgi:uncharacterized protein (DUF2126 family)